MESGSQAQASWKRRFWSHFPRPAHQNNWCRGPPGDQREGGLRRGPQGDVQELALTKPGLFSPACPPLGPRAQPLIWPLLLPHLCEDPHRKLLRWQDAAGNSWELLLLLATSWNVFLVDPMPPSCWGPLTWPEAELSRRVRGPELPPCQLW